MEKQVRPSCEDTKTCYCGWKCGADKAKCPGERSISLSRTIIKWKKGMSTASFQMVLATFVNFIEYK